MSVSTLPVITEITAVKLESPHRAPDHVGFYIDGDDLVVRTVGAPDTGHSDRHDPRYIRTDKADLTTLIKKLTELRDAGSTNRGLDPFKRY